jgi:hypothetical protein
MRSGPISSGAARTASATLPPRGRTTQWFLSWWHAPYLLGDGHQRAGRIPAEQPPYGQPDHDREPARRGHTGCSRSRRCAPATTAFRHNAATYASAVRASICTPAQAQVLSSPRRRRCETSHQRQDGGKQGRRHGFPWASKDIIYDNDGIEIYK